MSSDEEEHISGEEEEEELEEDEDEEVHDLMATFLPIAKTPFSRHSCGQHLHGYDHFTSTIEKLQQALQPRTHRRCSTPLCGVCVP